MAYTVLTDAEIAHKKPITLQQGRALRDNLTAVAAGDAGAPKVVGEALDDVWRAYLTGTDTTPSVLTGLARVKKVLLNITHVFGGSVNVRIAFSADGGATYGAYQVISNGAGGGTNGGRVSHLVLDLVTGALTGGRSGADNLIPEFSLVNSTLIVPANVNAFRFDLTSTGASYGINVYAIEGRA